MPSQLAQTSSKEAGELKQEFSQKVIERDTVLVDRVESTESKKPGIKKTQ